MPYPTALLHPAIVPDLKSTKDPVVVDRLDRKKHNPKGSKARHNIDTKILSVKLALGIVIGRTSGRGRKALSPFSHCIGFLSKQETEWTMLRSQI